MPDPSQWDRTADPACWTPPTTSPTPPCTHGDLQTENRRLRQQVHDLEHRLTLYRHDQDTADKARSRCRCTTCLGEAMT